MAYASNLQGSSSLVAHQMSTASLQNTHIACATPTTYACSPYEQRTFNFQTEVDLKPVNDDKITCLSINIAQSPSGTMAHGLGSPAYSAVG